MKQIAVDADLVTFFEHCKLSSRLEHLPLLWNPLWNNLLDNLCYLLKLLQLLEL